MSTVWALGDYHRFATTLIWHFGAELVADTGIERGMRVLDVATGTGNVALRAARNAARTSPPSTSSPRSSNAGAPRRRDSRSSGSRPTRRTSRSPTRAFDVVTSAAGAIFAPDHERRRRASSCASPAPAARSG